MANTAHKINEAYTIKDVKRVTKMGTTMIYELIKKGEFPKGHKISTQKTLWNPNEVHAWLEDVFAAPLDSASSK